jgi:hypothetical protein
MPIRNLDPDADYAFDKTNPSRSAKDRPYSRRRDKPSLVSELEARAGKCPSFNQHPHPLLYGVCTYCNAPKYAHTTQALRNRKLIL